MACIQPGHRVATSSTKRWGSQLSSTGTGALLWQPGTYLDQTASEINYTEFVNKELVLFSMADCQRSIPSAMDGLKPGQRKIIFSCFKRKLKSDVKVRCMACRHDQPWFSSPVRPVFCSNVRSTLPCETEASS